MMADRSISAWMDDPRRPDAAAAFALLDEDDTPALVARAGVLRDEGHPSVVSYSRKVFIPLTKLCRNVCHYCTFAETPNKKQRAFLTLDEVVAVAERGAAAGCREALFTLGDKPELRYRAAREELAEMGFESTIAYLEAAARETFQRTGLLPHLNPGVMTADELARLRKVSVSQGIMLESISRRLLDRGQCHHGSPDKDPVLRLQTIREAGAQRIPFTTGLLIGIGETRRERIEALLALRDAHEAYGHIQEIIIQNFRAKPGTKMHDAPEPDQNEVAWTIALARIVFGPRMNIQAPPNLAKGELKPLIDAGLNDWGGVSPVTPDFVNPEAPWPNIELLARQTRAAGKELVQRLALYPDRARDPAQWLDPGFVTSVIRQIDGEGYVRDSDWSPGTDATEVETVAVLQAPGKPRSHIQEILDGLSGGTPPDETIIVRLLQARGADAALICQTADDLRRRTNGDMVTYVVNRNINYTNLCQFKCKFCAFSKGKLSENLRGKPYDLTLDEIYRRTREAWERGATEVCMQGGIHPDYTGQTYIDIVKTVKRAVPEMHVHAFSPLEICHGAETVGVTVAEFLARLKSVGLSSLPGTAAEILDDEVRDIICPDKINTGQWLDVMRTAHALGLGSTATIMFGHVEKYEHVARHLLRLRALQEETGGFSEFVPLPFVHMEAPVYLKGGARRGPTLRETILLHAVSRLVLHPLITNIQASWVKMGPVGLLACLQAGCNDSGGTLMNESITRAAGARHGEEMAPQAMEQMISRLGRPSRQRSTFYGRIGNERRAASLDAKPLAEAINMAVSRTRANGKAVNTVVTP
jgi:FO synthase